MSEQGKTGGLARGELRPTIKEVHMAEQNKALYRRWFEEVWNQGREAAIVELCSPNVVGYGLGEVEPVQRGHAGFKAFWRTMRGALSDLHMTIDDLIAEGDKVAGRITLEAVHTGGQLGVPPSGRKIRVAGVVVVRFERGQIVEAWNSWDQLGLLRQIGTLETPGADRFVKA